ncbi:MAG: thioredoxin [Bauldia litoralis]
MTASPQPPAPLVLGHGATELEVFLEATCPHSKRAFDKLQPLLDAVGPDVLTIQIRFVPQSWHLYSGVVTRAILAASATEGGAEAGLKALAGVFRNRADFEFDGHHSGPNMNRTPAEILAAIADLAGVDLAEAWTWNSVTQALKWHIKYARQNGIHVSPTFMVDRIVQSDMGSRQTIEDWRAAIGV